MYFKCIKEFEVEKCDDNGFSIENEYFTVEENSIWGTDCSEIPCRMSYITLYGVGDNAFDYLEVPIDLLNTYFIKIDESEAI